MRLSFKLLAIASVVVLATVFAIIFPLKQEMRAQVVEDMQRELRAIAATAAQQIDGDLHAQLAASPSAESAEFQKLRAQLDKVRQANNLPHEQIYTFIHNPADPPNVLRFGVMTHPKPFVNDPYTIRRAELLDSWINASTHVADLYTDDHGQWISAYAPITNSAGEVTGVLEVDRSAGEYFARYRRVVWLVYYIGAGAILISAGLGYLVLNRLVLTPVKQLHTAMAALSASDFSHKVNITTKDELADLGHSLNLLSKQFNVARVIQGGFFPRSMPEHPNWSVAGSSLPCDATGGDYFDAFTLEDGSLCIVLADVSGHGLGPSLLMASCRSSLRALGLSKLPANDWLNRLDTLLEHDLQNGRFITLIVGLISPTGVFTYANAGHSPAMFATGTTVTNLSAHRPPLGAAFPDFPTDPAVSIQLSPGDRIFFASDGLTEAMDHAGNMPEPAAIRAIIANRALQPMQVLANLQAFLTSHTKGRKLTDDLTMICVDYVAQPDTQVSIPESISQQVGH